MPGSELLAKERVMGVIVSLLALAGVLLLMYQGYRLTIYLYSQSAGESDAAEYEPYSPARELMQAEHYGLRYARPGLKIGIVVFIIILIALMVIWLYG